MGVLGLGLFKANRTVQQGHELFTRRALAACTVGLLLILALVKFLVSLRIQFHSNPNEARDTAGCTLALDPGDELRGGRTIALMRTYQAYLDLQGRNADEWVKFKRGEQDFARGFALVFTAISGLYPGGPDQSAGPPGVRP